MRPTKVAEINSYKILEGENTKLRIKLRVKLTGRVKGPTKSMLSQVQDESVMTS